MKIVIVKEQIRYDGDTTICKLVCKVKHNELFHYILQNPRYRQRYLDYFKSQTAFNHRFDRSSGQHCFSVTASTKRTDRDVYDELTGKRLAEGKAFKKVYNIGEQICRFMANFYELHADTWEDETKYANLSFTEYQNILTLSNA
jgi:hypothetical protein